MDRKVWEGTGQVSVGVEVGKSSHLGDEVGGRDGDRDLSCRRHGSGLVRGRDLSTLDGRLWSRHVSKRYNRLVVAGEETVNKL